MSDEIIEVEDLDQFVGLLTAWHSNRVATLKHLTEIPEGTKVQVDDDETKLVLEGDLLKGFSLGITTALLELGKLPFQAEVIEENESIN